MRCQFEKYEVGAEIGQGGNATVYLAIQRNLERKVALKVLLPALRDDPGYLERFHLEARSIAKLRHPNIVTIYDEGEEHGVHYIAMEFLEGKDLHLIVSEKGKLSVQEAVEMAKCIAGALDYAHSNGIVHRDVKSSNIIMTSAGTAVLTDFGIAQSGTRSARTKTGSLLGTPEFMSPEQAAGKTVGPGTDFYSLGVVLYHAMSGHYPFQGESPIATIQKILYEDPVPLGRLVKLPRALGQLIELCLVKDPEKRVKDGKELIGLLNAVTEESPQRRVKMPEPRQAGPAVPKPPTGQTLLKPATGQAVPKSPSGQAVPKPASGMRESQATRRLSNPGDRAPQSSVRRDRGERRPRLLRTVVLAMSACMMLTGYVTWQKALKANVRTAHTESVTVEAPVRKLVPHLIGATKDDAITLLKREGFAVGDVRMVAVPNPGDRGKVDTQRPLSGTMAAQGTTVDLLIGE
jgi:serine/threonine protein kinase